MITTKFLRQYNYGDRVPQQFQEAVRVMLEPLAQTVILDGNLISNISLAGPSPVIVAHKLNRAYKGYFVTRANGALQVWDENGLNTSTTNTTQLNLSFSGTATTFSLWVF